jgi:hypothetical protein
VHDHIAVRSGSVFVLAEGFADLWIAGESDTLWLGALGPELVHPGFDVERTIAGMGLELLDASEIAQHLGLRGIRIALWDVLAAPRRFEATPALREWIRNNTRSD